MIAFCLHPLKCRCNGTGKVRPTYGSFFDNTPIPCPCLGECAVRETTLATMGPSSVSRSIVLVWNYDYREIIGNAVANPDGTTVLTIRNKEVADLLFDESVRALSLGYVQAVKPTEKPAAPLNQTENRLSEAVVGNILYRKGFIDQVVLAREGTSLFVKNTDGDERWRPWVVDITDDRWDIKPPPTAEVYMDELGRPTTNPNGSCVGKLILNENGRISFTPYVAYVKSRVIEDWI